MFWIVMISVTAVGAGNEPAAKGEPAGLFEGGFAFGKPEAGEGYRKGLAEFREHRYAEAGASFKKGRAAAAGKAETEAFDRLIREAKAGEDLERIRVMSEAKGSETKALGELKKALPRVKGLRLREEYRKLEDDLREIVYFILDDFEPEPEGGEKDSADGTKTEGGEGSGDAGGGTAKGGTGKVAEKSSPDEGAPAGKRTGKGGRGGGKGEGRNPFAAMGQFGKSLSAQLEGGEIQTISGGADKVFHGEGSFRWPVGKDLRVKILEFDQGVLGKHKSLIFGIRGSAGKTAGVGVALVHKGTDPIQFALGRFRGYSASVTVKGPAWKEHRLSIDKDFAPKDEPEKDRVVYVIFTVKNQPEQVLYLDDVRLER
jgi:hypothetical protein